MKAGKKVMGSLNGELENTRKQLINKYYRLSPRPIVESNWF